MFLRHDYHTNDTQKKNCKGNKIELSGRGGGYSVCYPTPRPPSTKMRNFLWAVGTVFLSPTRVELCGMVKNICTCPMILIVISRDLSRIVIRSLKCLGRLSVLVATSRDMMFSEKTHQISCYIQSILRLFGPTVLTIMLFGETDRLQ